MHTNITLTCSLTGYLLILCRKDGSTANTSKPCENQLEFILFSLLLNFCVIIFVIDFNMPFWAS